MFGSMILRQFTPSRGRQLYQTIYNVPHKLVIPLGKMKYMEAIPDVKYHSYQLRIRYNDDSHISLWFKTADDLEKEIHYIKYQYEQVEDH